MRNPLNKRLKRDLKSNVGRYFSMAALLFAAIAVISAFLVVAAGVAFTYKQNQIDCKVEDGQFAANYPIGTEILQDIEKLQLSVYKNFYAEMKALDDTTLRIYQNREEINLVSIMEGAFPESQNEIALDRLYAINNDLYIGDTIQIDEKDMIITGFISLPDYSSLFKNNSDLMMDSFHFGVAVVTKETFEVFDENKLNYNYSYYLEDRTLTENEKRDIANVMKELLVERQVQLSSFYIAEDNQSISFLGNDMGSDVPLIKVLLFIVIAVMGFVFSIVIRSTIEEESAIIGTLLASGYTKYEILWHYMSLPVLVTAASSVLGNVAAYTFMLNPFTDLYYDSYSLPPLTISFNLEALILTTILPVCIMLVINFITLSKTLSISPLRFLRKNLKKKSNKKVVKLPGFSFINRFRLRIILQNKGSYIMLFIGMFLASFLLMFALCINPLVTHHIDMIGNSCISEYQYVLKAPVQATEYTDQAEAFTIHSMETFCKLGSDDSEVTFYGITEKSDYFTDLSISEGEEGVYVSEGLLKKAGFKVGDKAIFTDTFNDKDYELKIIGTYDYPAALTVFMNQKQLNKLLETDESYFNGYFSNEELNIDAAYVATVFTSEDMTALGDQVLSTFSGMIPMIVGMSVIIYLVFMYILTKVVIDKNALQISFMKVFGYENGEIQKVFLRATTYTVIASLLLCQPLIYLGAKGAFYLVFMKISGYIEFYAPIYLYAAIVFIGFISYSVINYFHVRRVNHIEMAAALKDRE